MATPIYPFPSLLRLTITHKSLEVVVVYVGAKNYRSFMQRGKGKRCQKYLSTAVPLAQMTVIPGSLLDLRAKIRRFSQLASNS